ncbi:APC family permease [Fretibacterium sp. OH1220_COT-178]|uniref:APC family permease n=1 Tax=Fretibacterium sp. OH1220_COT-178 TaxID=2491047 RepID=UPI0018F3E90F|nr:amino acid permease [Fretibacterium sp. OH1220_COT-178]
MGSGMERAGARLKRSFGMREAVTITVGTVIGVGLFTVGANVVGLMGAAVILPTLVAMLVSVYPALLYAEMGAALPYAGGTYKYASLGLSKPMGMLAAWNFIISLVAVTSGEALAFSFYLKTAFRALGWELPLSDIAVACLVVAVFIVTNVRGVEITGRLQNGFMFFFWGVALVWFLMMIPNVRLPYFAKLPDYVDFRPASFIGAVAMIWWCFAGFETCCAMGEEIRYPQINIPRALFLAPFIVFAVNALFQWFMVGIVPTERLIELSTAEAPYADAMSIAGFVGIPLLTLALGIAFGGDFSTLNASIAVPPRYLFTMARDGAVPRFFAAVHPGYRTPWVAIVALGLLSIALIATGSIVYIASLSLFADLFYYVIGIVASMGLRVRHPHLRRPYRAPAIAVGAPASAVIYIVMMTQLNREAFWTGTLWCVLGLVVFKLCQDRYGRAGDEPLTSGVLSEEEPDAAERRAMDREYRRWCLATAAAATVALALYGIPYLMG